MRLKKPPGDELNKLLRVSNQALVVFGQPPLYAPERESSSQEEVNKRPKETLHNIEPGNYTKSFHISLAWSLAEPISEEQQRVSRIDLDSLKSLEIPFRSVKAKIGNIVHNLEL
jgi:U6 snRNA phosphodiesterase